MSTHRRLVRIGCVAAAAVAMLGLLPATAAPPSTPKAGSGTAQAAQASGAQPRADRVRAAAKGDFNIPPRDPMSPDGTGTYEGAYGGADIANTSASVSRSKVVVTLPPQPVLGYVQICLAIQFGADFFLQTCCPDVFDESTCPDKALVHREPTNYDQREPDILTLNWTENRARIWVSSPKGAKPFGTFAPAKVQLLAFGSVPVTATVNLTQPTGRDGNAVPLRYRDVNLASSIQDTVVGGLSNLRSDGTGANSLFEAVTTIGGPVDIRLSDVKVDGVPVNVGPNCRTVRPGTIDYRGPRGWVDGQVPTSQLAGRPGEFQPLNPDGVGAGTGNIAIPSFTGCRDGARSLDRLITAFASGPRNAVRLSLSDAIRECNPPAVVCPAFPPSASDMPSPALVAKALQRLPAQRRDQLRTRVAQLPSATRRLVLKAVPGLSAPRR